MKNNLEVLKILYRLINEEVLAIDQENNEDNVFDLLTKYTEEIDSLYSKNIEIPNSPNTAPIQPVQPYYPIYPTNPYPGYPQIPTIPYDPTQPWKQFEVWCGTNACAGQNNNLVVGNLNSDQFAESLTKNAKAWKDYVKSINNLEKEG